MSSNRKYTIHITFRSPVISQLQADTLFGHICWVLHYSDPDQLVDFLRHFDTQVHPPLIISNGIPHGLFPKPIIPAISQEELDQIVGREDRVKRAFQIKCIKQMEYITVDHFKKLQQSAITPRTLFEGMFETTELLLTLERREKEILVQHNTIDRVTGRIWKGGLYSHNERFYDYKSVPSSSFQVYVCTNYFSRDELAMIFRCIGEMGYGKNKSTGKGHFEFYIEDGIDLPQCSSPNGFMTLSNFIPGKDDPPNGYYNIMHKFGKIGGTFLREDHVSQSNPFKKPLLMLTSGSTFFDENIEPTKVYGCFLKDVHPNSKIRHYAYAFPIGIRLSEVI